MATNEFFFPDTETVRIYIDMIHNQGMEVCRNKIDKDWLDGSLSKFSFGIAIYTNKAQIGQSRKKKTDKQLKGVILCRIDNDSPYTVWIDLVCSRETSRVGTKLHRPKRKMRQNAVMSCIFYNYVSSSLINEFL